MNIDWKDYENKQSATKAARAFAADALKQAFPHLVAASENMSGLIAAAKNIRIELKRAFPSVKFSVKTERFSMGNAIRVCWTDGPTSSQVEEITNKYVSGDFDGMTDCYNYRKDHAWVDAFGSGKYITSSREYSPALVQIAIDYIWNKYLPEAEKISTESYFNGTAWSVCVVKGAYPGDANAQTQIHRFAHQYDCIAQTLLKDHVY